MSTTHDPSRLRVPTSAAPRIKKRGQAFVTLLGVSLAAVAVVGLPILGLARHDLVAEQTMGVQSRAFERRLSELALHDARHHRCHKGGKSPSEVLRCGDKSEPYGGHAGDEEVLKSFAPKPSSDASAAGDGWVRRPL